MTTAGGPLVSVALPVYNGATTVREAIDSVLAQTYTNFELIVVNDGSTDETGAVLASIRDPRLRVLHQENRGVVPTLNRAVLEARGPYIARLDADDLATPDRFARQVAFLEGHPTVAAVGGAARVVYPDGSSRIRRCPPDTAGIRRNVVRICPMFHAAVMIRRSVFDRIGLYDPAKDGSKRLLVADYDLWARVLAAGYDLANLPDIVLINRRAKKSVIRGRPLSRRLRQQILSRIDVIRRLRLGYRSYLDIVPVVAVSVLAHYGMRIDPLFNLVASTRRRRSASTEDLPAVSGGRG